MRKLLVLAAISCSVSCFSQPDTILHKRMDSLRISAGLKPLNRTRDTIIQAPSMREVDMEQMNRNMLAFTKQQKERRDKEFRNSLIRIGIGVVLFVVLIVGMRRKRVKK